MSRWLAARLGLLLLGGATLLGCGSSADSSGSAKACVPGNQVACACPGGGQGVQVCSKDGSSLGACTGCSAVGDAAATGGDADAQTQGGPDSASDQDAAPVDPCQNGLLDGFETDIDCGGSQCKPCAPGKKCVAKTDCSWSACQDGKCPVPDCGAPDTCDDKNACTIDTCSIDKGCEHKQVNDGSPCTPADLCKQWACSAGVCAPTGDISCDDKNPCTKDACSPATGCTHEPASNVPCDDLNLCTKGDTCVAGSCTPGTGLGCDCLADSDCTAKANPCTGPMICDKTKAYYTCAPKAPISPCPDPDPKDCVVPVCDPAASTLQCQATVLKDGSKCDDGIDCTVGDACKKGQCVYDASMCECLTNSDCTVKYGDGKLCSGNYSCTAQHTCAQNPPPICDTSADTACIVTKCDEATGKCAPTPVKQYPLACDDGNSCTMGDVCEKTDQGIYTGQCVGGTNVCGCTKNADCAAKEDGDLCNGTLYCNLTSHTCELNPTTVVTCPTADDTTCLKHLCNKQTGQCETIPREYLLPVCPLGNPSCGQWLKLPADSTPTPVPCDDGNPCSLSSACMNGQCAASANAMCQCQIDADCAQTGDKCAGTYVCNKASGKCVVDLATIPFCSSAADTVCAKNTCNPATGACFMKPTASGAAFVACEDGNACTKFDYCDSQGKCTSGSNTCQCQADADCAKLEDGDVCNGTLWCNAATAKCEVAVATVVVCSAAFDTPCSKNVCQPATGQCQMVQKNDYLVCDDGSDCTGGDYCLDGACLSGNNQCACTSDADCSGSQSTNPCDGTLYCDLTVPKHQCKIKPGSAIVCPANSPSPCLVNACDPAKGACALLPNPELFAKCDDGNPCTLADYCKDGTCQSGGNVCTCASNGDCDKFNNGNPCSGKLICTGTASKTCTVDPATVVACSGGTECNQNVCDPKTGKCASVVVQSACDDGNPCTIDACSAGKCSHAAINDPKVPCSITDATKACMKGVCQKP